MALAKVPNRSRKTGATHDSMNRGHWSPHILHGGSETSTSKGRVGGLGGQVHGRTEPRLNDAFATGGRKCTRLSVATSSGCHGRLVQGGSPKTVHAAHISGSLP